MTFGGSQKLVSIIIPTHNRRDLLPRTLGSVYRQTYRPLEIVVVDDGSTDDTLGLLEQFKGQTPSDTSLRVIGQSHRGAPAARNVGFRESSGEYVLFLDSDDELERDMVAACAAQLEASGGDLVFAGFAWVCDVCGQQVGGFVPQHQGDDALVDLCSGRLLWAQGTTLGRRASLGDSMLWREDLVAFQDLEFMARLLRRSPPVAVVPRVLTTVHVNGVPRIADSYANATAQWCYLEGAKQLVAGLRERRYPHEATALQAASRYRTAVGLRPTMPLIAAEHAALAGELRRHASCVRAEAMKLAYDLGTPACQAVMVPVRLRHLAAHWLLGHQTPELHRCRYSEPRLGLGERPG